MCRSFNGRGLVRQWLTAGLLLIAISTCLPAFSSQTDILVISSQTSDIYTHVEQSIRLHLNHENGLPEVKKVRYHSASMATADQKIIDINPSLVVTIGSKAMKQYWAIDVPRLYAFVSFNTFSQLKSSEPSKNDRYGVIFLDQPLNRQLMLARKLIPKAKVGLLLSNQSSNPASAYLSSQIVSEDNNIVVSYVDKKEQLVNQAKKLLNEVDILLATPDTAVWQPSSAKWLLYLAYQQRKPVVGFSEALTRAGTIASVYSEPKQIGRQIAEAINSFSDGRVDWQKNTGPEYFRYSLNETIANSLGISDDTLQAIEQQAN